MRWEMVFASRVLSGEKVLGSFREYQDTHQKTGDRSDGESAALLKQCVCSEASPTQTRRTASPVGPIPRNPRELKPKYCMRNYDFASRVLSGWMRGTRFCVAGPVR